MVMLMIAAMVIIQISALLPSAAIITAYRCMAITLKERFLNIVLTARSLKIIMIIGYIKKAYYLSSAEG